MLHGLKRGAEVQQTREQKGPRQEEGAIKLRAATWKKRKLEEDNTKKVDIFVRNPTKETKENVALASRKRALGGVIDEHPPLSKRQVLEKNTLAQKRKREEEQAGQPERSAVFFSDKKMTKRMKENPVKVDPLFNTWNFWKVPLETLTEDLEDKEDAMT
jgi:hypothetical protein